MDCMATIREAPPQLRQAAYATQSADAAGPNAATDDNHATRGEYDKHTKRLLSISSTRNINKFHNKFVVPKKNRVDLNSINLELLINLSNLDFKIINIKFDNNIDENQESIDDLIYNFNNGSIKITNWIEFKNFTNDLISLYAG